MLRVLGLLVALSACSTHLADPPAPPPSTVRERLEEPTRLLIAASESGGSLTAERKVASGWQGGLVDLGIENGEVIVSSDARDAVTVDGMQIVFEPLEIPPGVFGSDHAQLTNVRIDLTTDHRAPAVWTSENEAHLTAMLDLTLSWELTLNGAPTRLGSPTLPPIPVEIVLTGDGSRVNAEVRAHAPGELWAWAGLIRLSELQLILGADAAVLH
jgi:hypothetical protein